ETAHIAATDGTIAASTGSDRLDVAVTAASVTRLVVTGSGAQTAGGSQSITITATDPYGNTDQTYTGSHNLTFSGAGDSTDPVTHPTVSNTAFGSSTSVSFTAGQTTATM